MIPVCFRIAVFLLLLPYPGLADIFVWNTPEGKTYYSDQNRAGSRKLVIHPGYSYHRVSRIYDGDTLFLENGQIVRLAGINTPEIEGKYRHAEPGGEQAKKWLIKRLGGKKVRLQLDIQKKDRYGRTLAYIFTQEGDNVNVELVRQGLAFVNIYPPNLAHAQALQMAQALAEAEHRGIWRLPYYRITPIKTISPENYRGWKRLSAQVQNIRQGRKYSYLDLTTNVNIRIANKNLHLFPDLRGFVGKHVIISGWLARKKQSFSILLRHPSSIKVLD